MNHSIEIIYMNYFSKIIMKVCNDFLKINDFRE